LNTPEFKDYKNARKLTQSFLLANSTISNEVFQCLRNHENISTKEILEILKRGERLVDVLCYSVMPDHYHLLLRERKKSGISNFIRKGNISIAKYINIKNNRLGPIFESRFKAKHIDSNEYLLHLSLYIHLNPLDILAGKEWRKGKLKDWSSKKKRLLNYPWSSIKAFLDNDYQDPIISGTKIILGQFRNKKNYEAFLRDWSEDTFNLLGDFIID
jgi:putative transposase